MKAISVTSGGMDSITNGLMMLKKGYEVVYLHFDYDQKSRLGERLSCEKIVEELKKRGFPVSYVEVPLTFPYFVKEKSCLTSAIPVPLGINSIRKSATTIDELWVPARNVIFLAYATSIAEALEADVITLGANRSESSYPDNTKEFLDRFQKMAEFGTLRVHPKFESPEWGMDKVHILKWGFDNGFGWVYSYTWSCDLEPVFIGNKLKRESVITEGECGCCCNRRMAFHIAKELYGIEDNQRYANEKYFEKFLEDVKKSKEKFWFSGYLCGR